jgi:hypothetical protein
LPAKARSVVGFFGFQHDRKLALKALAFSASRNDVHSTFAGYGRTFVTGDRGLIGHYRLGLMTYLGVILLMSGWQANEQTILTQYEGIVDK